MLFQEKTHAGIEVIEVVDDFSGAVITLFDNNDDIWKCVFWGNGNVYFSHENKPINKMNSIQEKIFDCMLDGWFNLLK